MNLGNRHYALRRHGLADGAEQVIGQQHLSRRIDRKVVSFAHATRPSSATPAATASATTRGPSRRAKPGSRRRARRRNLRTTSFSGLEIGWVEGFFFHLPPPSKRNAVA